jgi:hypothetical protein
MYTVVTAQGACHAPSARRALRGRCSVGRRVRGWSSPLTGASRTGLGWHWQDNAQLAAGPGPAERAHSPAACLSAARGRRCVGQGTPKQHARAPELRGGAMLVDSQAIMMGGRVCRSGRWVRAAGGARHARAPPWLRGRSGQAGGRTATRTAAAARRAQAALSTGRPGHKPIRPRGARSNLDLDSRIGEWRTMPCTRPSSKETFQQSM